ncbi:murein biosynthesis integral membrane protein MurJ [Allorhizocola rhizosphaerae]|uniref:murein biosynthesis integral membrane protein MurJ n=1 Tax=Allorhizocola rhizosphaerae TaxID=1872709 RepID=UPI000E3ECFAA|nr:murein biosynthesis integral membrane protein MurJ [Allorhizocola rhizosphaerae]
MVSPERPAPDSADATVILPRVDAAPPPREAGSGGAARNSAIMAAGSLVSRITGFLRTAVLAAALGGGLVANAYNTALAFPGMVYELLLGGIMSSVLVPMLVRARKQDADRGEAYTQRLLTLAVVVLGIATVLAVICAPLFAYAYASDGTAATRSVITALSYLMLPTIFFYGLSGIVGAILNSRGSFAAPMWTPILNNLVVIALGVYYMVELGTEEIAPEDVTPAQILVLGGGMLLGITLQALALLPALRKVGFRFRWRTDFRRLRLGQLGRVGAWMFLYVGVNQLALVLMFNLLNRVGDDEAGTAIYSYAFLLLMMAHGIVAVSVITAVLPRMSSAAADGRAGDVADDLNRGIRMTTVLLAPIAVGYVVLALPISIALFERGVFDRVASANMATVLVVAGLTLLPMSISQLFNFTYYSLQDTRTPALINLPVVSLRLSVQLAWFAAFAVSATAVGMMVGNGLSFVFAALFSGLLIRRRIGRIGLRAILGTSARVLAAAVIAAAAGFGVLKLLGSGEEMTRNEAWLALITGGVVIFAVYGVAALALGTREIKDVLALVRRKIGR